MNAIKNYDFERGVPYYGYLSFWVKRTMQSFCSSYPYLIHIPSNKLALLESFETRVQRLLQIYEFVPPSEMFNFENISEKEREKTYDLLCNIDSIVDPLGEEQLYADERYSADYYLDLESLKYQLNHYLYFLSNRESDIITSYFNLNGKNEITLTDIANRYNKTRERIRQIFEAGMRRLRILHMFKYAPSLLTVTDRDYVMERIKVKRTESSFQDQLKKERTKIAQKVVKQIKNKSKKSNNKSNSARKTQNKAVKQIQQTFQLPKHNVIEKTIPNSDTLPNTVKIGDRILYDSKPCIVLEKRTKYGFTRLILKYDNGTYDNVPDNTDRYIII